VALEPTISFIALYSTPRVFYMVLSFSRGARVLATRVAHLKKMYVVIGEASATGLLALCALPLEVHSLPRRGLGGSSARSATRAADTR